MKSHQQRIEYIARTVEEVIKYPNRATYKIASWRGNELYEPIVKIDVSYLMFRIENSRTLRQQLRYLRNNPDLSSNFFSDPEAIEVQNAQQQILLDMIKASGKDFQEDLQNRGQQEPAIITFDGYIVNGNRRVAALRELNEQYIQCVVLPSNAVPKDIYELEQELQISQDFKEPYHWINELANISRGIKDQRYGETEDNMAKRLRLQKPVLKQKLLMMELLEQYLIWKEIPKQYDYLKLDEAEEAFIQLAKALNSNKYKNDANKSEALMKAVFNLIEEKPSTGRLYGYVTDLIRNFEQVYIKLKENTELKVSTDTTRSSTSNITQKTNSLLDDLIDENSEYELNIFNDPDKASEVSSELVEAIADVKAENKEKQGAEAVFQAVGEALRQLQGLSIDTNTVELLGIKNKLIQIINTANILLNQMEDNINEGN